MSSSGVNAKMLTRGRFDDYYNGAQVKDGVGMASVDWAADEKPIYYPTADENMGAPIKYGQSGDGYYTHPSFNNRGNDPLGDASQYAEEVPLDYVDYSQQAPFQNMQPTANTDPMGGGQPQFATRYPLKNHRRCSIENDAPFMGPGQLAAMKRSFAAQGLKPATLTSQRQRKYDPTGRPYVGPGSGNSGGGGGPRVGYYQSRAKIVSEKTVKFQPYPREEFPLYGRYPVYNPRFEQRWRPRSAPVAFGMKQSTIRASVSAHSTNNHNHGLPFIASHVNQTIAP